jgi:hypothetical protein
MSTSGKQEIVFDAAIDSSVFYLSDQMANSLPLGSVK